MAIRLPFGRRPERPQPHTELQADERPKRGLFAEPVRVTSLQVLDPEVLDDGQHRATFLVEVRDAEDKRCSELFVEATLSNPERTATVSGATDLFGRIRFRMAGPPGDYRIVVEDVAAGGLDWDRDAGPKEADVTLS